MPCACNEHRPARRHANYGNVEGPWVRTSIGGVSPLSLPTFFALAPRRKSPWGTKKVGAAPHRGNARAARRIADASSMLKKTTTKQRSQTKTNNQARGTSPALRHIVHPLRSAPRRRRRQRPHQFRILVLQKRLSMLEQKNAGTSHRSATTASNSDARSATCVQRACHSTSSSAISPVRSSSDSVCSEMRLTPIPAITACLIVSLLPSVTQRAGVNRCCGNVCSATARVPGPGSRNRKVSPASS